MAIFIGTATARFNKPVVLFLIGMRINNFLALGDILFMSKTMPAMLKELSANKESGMLWYRQQLSLPYINVQQYWESFDKLLAYAHDKEGHHFPIWAEFCLGGFPTRRTSASGTKPIWSSRANSNTSHGNMPLFGSPRRRDLSHSSSRRGRLAAAKDRYAAQSSGSTL